MGQGQSHLIEESGVFLWSGAASVYESDKVGTVFGVQTRKGVDFGAIGYGEGPDTNLG